MKQNKSYVGILFVFIALLFSHCDKEPEVEPDHFRCRIDGVTWDAGNSLTGEVNEGLIILNGVSGKGDTLRMLIQDQLPGTYPIKNISNITILKTGGKTYLPLNSADGFLTITRHSQEDALIEGSFYLTVDAGQGDWKEITDGKFKVTY
jgi:hypothetical protein